MRLVSACLVLIASNAHASHVVKVYRGSEPGLAISVRPPNAPEASLEDSVFLSLNPRISESFLYRARVCFPFVKCITEMADALLVERYGIYANVDAESEKIDSLYFGPIEFKRTGFAGALIETAGTLGIGPQSHIATHFAIKFSTENRNIVSFIPNHELPPSSIALPIDPLSGTYALPLGSRIHFAPIPGVLYSTPSDIQIIFDPTDDLSTFPNSVLLDLVESLGPAFHGKLGQIQTGQLIVLSHFGINPAFSLSLADNATLIPLTNGIDQTLPPATSLRGSSGILTDYKFNSETKVLVIGGSILKNYIRSITLANDRILIDRVDEPLLSIAPIISRLPRHPELAGLAIGFSPSNSTMRLETEPLPDFRPSLFSLRPHLGSQYVLQNKYRLLTSAPVSVLVNGTRTIGYVMECIEFNELNYRGPQFDEFSVLVQIDPRSNGGVVNWEQESGFVSLPLVQANSNDSGQVYKVKALKTPKKLFIILIPHVMEEVGEHR